METRKEPFLIRDSKEQGICLSVVVPTYNESENIKDLIVKLAAALDTKLPNDYEIIIVDDHSPDRTGEIVHELLTDYPQVKLVDRKNEKGLSGAVIRGWQASHGKLLGVIDGDLQHPPETILELLEGVLKNPDIDLALASRNIKGGGVSEWSLARRIVSRGAQMLGLILIPSVAGRVSDPMSGYFIVRRNVIAEQALKPIGYKILLEVMTKGNINRILEVGYIFQERKIGKSKVGISIYLQYILQLIYLWVYKCRIKLEGCRKNNQSMMNKKYLIPLLSLLVISIVYTLPVMTNMSYLGSMDWDQFIFWNAVPRDTILRYHQFPLWNPYANGGNVLLAHPDSSFLSPLYIFVLIFGPIVGLKLQIIVHLFIGLWGMFLLARYMEIGKVSAYLSSFVYMLSSAYALHLSEGQAEWLALAFVPWVFLYYLQSINDHKKVLGAVLFLGLILISGVYVFSLLVVFLSIYAPLKSFQIKRIVPVQILAMVFAGAFLLCSIKLFPMLEFLHQYPRLTDGPEGVSGPVLLRMLAGREQAFSHLESWRMSMSMGLPYGWHEYGAYIGIVPLLLFFGGGIIRFKKNWPLVLTSLLLLVMVLGDQSSINLWGILHGLPLYNSLHVPTRFIVLYVFSAALVAGFGLSFLEEAAFTMPKGKNLGWAKKLSLVIVLFVLFDLWQVNSPILKNTALFPPRDVNRNFFFAQRYHKMNLYGEALSYSSVYPIFLTNSGILDAYEIVNVQRGDVRIMSDPNYKGEVYLAHSKGYIINKYFSPNKLTVDIDMASEDILVVNQNYYTGWKAKNGWKAIRVEPFHGLIAAPVSSGRQRIVFYYMPFSFLAGLFVTTGFILSIMVLCIKNNGVNQPYNKREKKRSVFSG